MSKLRFCSKRTQKEWARIVDQATPSQRRLLDVLESLRPDMAPVKLVGGWLQTPLRRGGIGVYGGASVAWVRREIRRVRAEKRRERARLTTQLIGAFI